MYIVRYDFERGTLGLRSHTFTVRGICSASIANFFDVLLRHAGEEEKSLVVPSLIEDVTKVHHIIVKHCVILYLFLFLAMLEDVPCRFHTIFLHLIFVHSEDTNNIHR